MTATARKTYSFAELAATTPQELFDQVVPALMDQGKAAYDKERGSCAYRESSGAMCAIGIVLNEEAHAEIAAKGWQGRGFNAILDIVLEGGAREESRYIINELQESHDLNSVSNGKEWYKDMSGSLEAVARRKNLDPSVLINHKDYVG